MATAAANTPHPPAPTLALVYNPASGSVGDDPQHGAELLRRLEAEGFAPTLFVVQNDDEIDAAMHAVLAGSFPTVAVYGGDGTVESVANHLIDSETKASITAGITLGILPGGTRNNLAASLAIPTELPQAVALLRNGRPRRIDAAHARCGEHERWLLELLTVGLATTAFEDAEAIQKGKLTAVGDLIAQFVGAAPATIHLGYNTGTGNGLLEAEGHAVLGLNTPYLGANYHFADGIACDDGYLDLFVYDQLSKLDLVADSVAVATGGDPDPRIRRLRVRELALTSDPPLPILVDGVALGEGPVTVRVRPQALQVITGTATR